MAVNRLLVVLVIVLASLALSAQPASAHATYVRSNPAADARLLRAPAEIRITWSEQVDVRFSEILVLDPAGQPLHEGRTQPGDDDSSLRIGLRALAEGGYTVSWRVLSSVDGHETRGSFAFAIGDAPLPTLAIEDAGGGRTPSALEIIARWLGFAGIALVLGAGIFLLVVRPPASASVGGPARFGALAILVSAVLLITDQMLSQSRSGLIEALSGTVLSRQGALFGLRLGAVSLALTACSLLRRGSHIPLGAALTVAGTFAALAAMLGSHAAAAGEPLGMAIDLAHIGAMSAWAGGLVCLASVALLRRGAKDAEPLGAMVWRFSLLALVSVALLVTTGTVASLTRLRLVEDLYETPYGVALAVKIVLLVVALALGARNLLVHGARLRREEAIAQATRAIRRNALVESGLVGVILVATAFLTALVPPAQAATAPIDQIQRVDGVRIGIKVASTLPGRNSYQVSVTEGLRPARDVERVLLRFTMQTMDMGESELEAKARRPGEWVAEGSATSMYGPWNALVIVRRSDRDDLRAVFTLELVAPAGRTAAARVISVPPYTLIVFTDPAEPVAGAPFSISIVVADDQGRAVSDATVRGTLQGPEPTELAAVSAIAGRYALPLRGLPPGVYTAAIEIVRSGASTRSSFIVEVAR